MGAIASQIPSLTIVYSTVYSGADQRKHVTGLCAGNSPWPVNSPHKWPVTRKMFPLDDVIMWYKKPMSRQIIVITRIMKWWISTCHLAIPIMCRYWEIRIIQFHICWDPVDAFFYKSILPCLTKRNNIWVFPFGLHPDKHSLHGPHRQFVFCRVFQKRNHSAIYGK